MKVTWFLGIYFIAVILLRKGFLKEKQNIKPKIYHNNPFWQSYRMHLDFVIITIRENSTLYHGCTWVFDPV